MPEPTYFTCTLGQATGLPKQEGPAITFSNIPDFIERQAQQSPNLPAAGFYVPSTSRWQHRILTFQDVCRGTLATASRIKENVDIPEKQTVALLCPSTLEFLLTWLALMRLGHPVLLIAPQCSAKAIAQLCQQCQVATVFVDEMYLDLAKEAASTSVLHSELSIQLLPFEDKHTACSLTKQTNPQTLPRRETKPEDIAYLHHSSGTSSGTPKPIPQTHRAGCGVLPRLDGSAHATFTTTPLYHGGIADLFRAWTSNALIWLFPGKDVPITAGNVVKCLEVAEEAGGPAVKYFSSVPYVLQMMAADEGGMKYLQKMDVVGVGGAALPKQVGDGLVEQGVNLISRFGSAECGFLMSSHRKYADDKEWRYLRSESGSACLDFEPREGGLHELVVRPGWPHMAKTNRDDGSFATADLFAAHDSIPNAWRYDSRADSQVTLVTGKKFDPAPIEAGLAATSNMLSDVFVFGNGMPYPGALLFRSEAGECVDDEQIVRDLAPAVSKMNSESASHARIPRNMLIPLPFDSDSLDKSSKGTIMRGKAEEQYATTIQEAYERVSFTDENVLDGEVEHAIADIVKSIVGSTSRQAQQLDAQTDLFAFGVDSVACVQIRHAIARLLPKQSPDLPLTVVQDCGTIEKLKELVLDTRHGRAQDSGRQEDQIQLMKELVEQYSQLVESKDLLPPSPPRSPNGGGRIILLTGATGSIGSHILHQLLSAPGVAHIHVLLRGATLKAARERVFKALEYRKLSLSTAFDAKCTIHICNLSESHLGLSNDIYAKLVQEVDVILHLAWSVDFLLPLKGFRQHFAALQSLLTLSLSHSSTTTRPPADLIFCSSVASVASHPTSSPVPEIILTDPGVSGTIGYSRSKWVAENICLRAAQRHPQLAGHVAVVRVGQVSGDTTHGVWNATEAYPLMLSSARITGCLPDLPGESVGWIPVDTAAAAFVEVALHKQKVEVDGGGDGDVAVMHVLNQDRSTTWTDLLSWLQEESAFDIVPVQQWLQMLEASTDRGHASLKLLEFWKRAYGQRTVEGESTTNREGEMPAFEVSRTLEAMPVLGAMGPINREYALKLWRWMERNV